MEYLPSYCIVEHNIIIEVQENLTNLGIAGLQLLLLLSLLQLCSFLIYRYSRLGLFVCNVRSAALECLRFVAFMVVL